MGKLSDLTGKRFGRLTVIQRNGTRCGHATWDCVCDCGKTVIVIGSALKSNRTTSCGCYRRENTGNVHRKHGKAASRVYVAWQHMKQRCGNPENEKYRYYGGRGIKICEEWDEFEPFEKWAIANGYKNGLTLDRIDVNGDYNPENCRWVSWKVQQNNKRNNTVINANGESHTLAQWEEITGICRSTIQKRIKMQGQTPEIAMRLT